MTKKYLKITQFIFILTAIALWTKPASASFWPELIGGFQIAKRPSKEKVQDVYQQLNLSEDQKLSLEKNRKRNHEKIKKLNTEISDLKKQLAEELENPQLDEKKVRRIRSKLNHKESELSDLRLEGIIEIREIFTPEQYDLFHRLTN